MYKKCMRSHCLSDFIYCKVLTLPSPYTLEYTYEYIYKWCQVQIYSNFLDRWFDIKVEYVLKKTKDKLIFLSLLDFDLKSSYWFKFSVQNEIFLCEMFQFQMFPV